MAPADAASSTSLSLVANRWATSRSSDSGRATRATWRSEEIGSLRTLGGAVEPKESTSAAAARRASPAKPSTRLGERTVASGARTISSCRPTRSRTPPASRASGSGGRAGRQPSGSELGGGSGSGSSRSAPSSTAAIPSTRQWWALPTRPTRPSPRRSAIQISHRGRRRSSGRDMTVSVSSARLAAGDRRTWRETSNASSSTHTGASIPSGTLASR